MLRSILKRVIQLVPVLWGISTVVFFLQRLIPGSPADAVLGPDAPETQKLEWLATYGFDKPVLEQYVTFLWNLVRLDLGKSFANATPVADMIAPRLAETAQLAAVAFSLSLVIATAVGLVSAAFVGRFADKATAVGSLLAISAPAFITGPVLIWIFAVRLDVLPLIGNEGWRSFVLPTVCLAAPLAAFSSRMIRSGLVDVLSEDYIRTARSKGLAPWRVLVRHALRNAFLPALTVLGMQLGVLLSGAVITEQIFAWPGLGTLTIESVQAREYNVVSGCVLVMACVYVFSNLLVDMLYRVFDPRVRAS